MVFIINQKLIIYNNDLVSSTRGVPQDEKLKMNDLLFEVARKDAELAKAREGAKPAGEADPYKHTEE